MLARLLQHSDTTYETTPCNDAPFVALAALATLAAPAFAQTGEIRIAHVHSMTGPLEAYGKQTQTGLMMGLEYATAAP